MTIDEVNALAAAEFAARFGMVAEHSPWVAEGAGTRRPFSGRDAMVEAFQRVVAEAGRDRQLALLRSHPDLAGRARLAEDSRREQEGAGLDSLTPAELERFGELNGRYRARFGIPFILAVKGAGKDTILAAFEQRVGGGREEEILTALAQVLRIIRFRIEDRVDG